jgi:putative ABC transport system permease protein
VSLLLYWCRCRCRPAGQQRGLCAEVTADAGLYAATLLAMLAAGRAGLGLVARRTVHTPVVQALAHT